jgi:drug/metabolite transporter (DMT)-like permease
MHDLSSRVRGSSAAGPLAAFALLALIWGYNWVVMKVALRYSGPLEFAAWRCALGALLLFAALAALKVPLAPRQIGKTLVLGLFQTTGFVGLVSLSLTIGAAGKNAVLAYTMPFWVIAFGWPFLPDRLRGAQWIAVALALPGLLLVLEIWNHTGGWLSSSLALAAGASWGISVVVFKRIELRDRNELLALTAWQMLFGSIPLVAGALLVPERGIDWHAGPFIAALVFNIVGGMAIATLLWQYVLHRLPTTISSLSSLIVPIVGVLAAWLQLGERPSPLEGAGMGLILLGLALLPLTRRETALEP